MHFCPNMKLLRGIPEFQKMMEYYSKKHYSEPYLAIALELFRERHNDKYTHDWIPENSRDYAVFTRFLNHELRKTKLTTTGATLERSEVSNIYDTLYTLYTPEQLSNRLKMIANKFREIVDDEEEKDTIYHDRQQLIKSFGSDGRNGFMRVLDRVFAEFARKFESVDKIMADYDAAKPNATPEQRAKAKERAEYVFEEMQTVLNNKERLGALAAIKIGENEGFAVNVSNFTFDIRELSEEDLSEPLSASGENDGTDPEESSKGDRYADFRLFKMMNTLGPRARRLIGRIHKTDARGRRVKDDLGNEQFLDNRQAMVTLTRAILNSRPETMLDDLRAAADYSPWINEVINELVAHPQMQTTVWCNFKKAATIYVYTNLNSKEKNYDPKIANTRSSGHALMRDAGVNLQAGYVLNEPASVYVDTGYLRSLAGIRQIRSWFTKVKSNIEDGVKNIRMVDGDSRPKTPVHEYEKLKPIDAMAEYLKQNPEVLEQVSNMLRGLGYSVTPSDIETISLQTMNKKGYRFVAGRGNTKSLVGRNKLYHLVQWIDKALAQAEWVAESGDVKTGQYFYNTSTDEFRMIDNCLALAKYDEVEPRVNNDGKSMSTFNNTNLLHQIADELTNVEDLDETSYQTMLENEYLRYEGMSLGKDAVGWLKWFKEGRFHGTDMRRTFRVYNSNGFNHVEYGKMTREQILTNAAIQFFGASKMFSRGSDPFCAVMFPIESDYTTAYDFMYVPMLKVGELFDESTGEYGYQSELVDALVQEVLVELERISSIEERIKNDPDGKKRAKLTVYEREGLKFQIFPEFNTNGFREEYTALSDKAKELDKKSPLFGINSGLEGGSANEAYKLVRQRVAEQLQKIREKDIETVEKSGILKNYNLHSYGLYSKDGMVKSLSAANQKKLDNWFFNTFYARLQMTKIWDGGLHNFDGLIDFEKRNMLTHATRTSLYTKAMWNGEQVGKESQNVVYVGDEVSASAFYEDIKSVLKDLKDDKVITARQFRGMLRAYAKIKSTDGQGIRTLESYRSVMVMTDQWDDRHEDAYQRVIKGSPLKGDIDLFMQPIKPVASGFEHIDAAEGENQKPVKLTFLHKYSEICLLPVALAKYCQSAKSVPLRAFDIAQSQLKKAGKPVDMFLFHSGAKVGAHSIIKPFQRWGDFKTDEERRAHGWNGEKLSDRILKNTNSIKNYIVKSINENKWTVHEIPFKYYGIAASTPPHGVDDRIARASQKEKTVWANISPNDEITITINGQRKRMKATAARDLYYKIKTATIIESYEKLRSMFDDTDELERVFQTELANKSYQPQELKFALSHLKNGTFAVPLFSPGVEHQVQQLLASIIKKRMTKVKTKGANVLVSTALGMEVDVSPYEGSDGFPESFKLGIEFGGEGRNKHLKWFDAGLPLPEALKEFADKNGNITPEMLWGKDGTGKTEGLVFEGIIPIEALLFDASRTPSDAEHSTVPCRVKWFSAKIEGGNAKIAKEAMVTTGQDFDGDKLRMDFKEYDVIWDEDKLNEEYDRLLGIGTEEGAANLAIGNIRNRDVNRALSGFKKWREWAISDSNPDKMKYRKVRVVEYDMNKSPLENSARARHNMMMQLTFGQLTSPAGSRRVLIPGGCEESKIYAKSLQLIRLATNDEIKNQLFKTMTDDEKHGGLNMSIEDAAEALQNTNTLYEALIGMDDGMLTTLVKSVGSTDVPYSLTHAVDSFEYLMGGAEMIGIYALYNSAAQMMQRLDLHYVPFTASWGETFDITLFPDLNDGKKIDKLFDIKNKRGNLLSLGLARLLNAAVDNGKDPILGLLNQTKEMAEITSFLFAAGIDEEQVHLIMNQPAVVELIHRLKGRDSEGMEKEIDKLVAEIQNQFGDKALSFTKGMELVSKMNKDDYVAAIPNSFQSYTKTEDMDAANKQTAVLYLLNHLRIAANNLAEFTRLTRPESDSGAIGSSVANIINKLVSLTKFRNKLLKSSDSEIRIKGLREVMAKIGIHDGMDNEHLLSMFENKGLSEVVALNTLMMDSSLDMLKPFFPQARMDWVTTIMEVMDMYKYKNPQDGIIEKIAQEMILWKLLSDRKFIAGDPKEEQKRIIVEVPSDLAKLKKRIEDAKQNPETDKAAEALIGNTFLEKLTTTSPENSRTNPRISFSLNGPAVEGTADSIRAYWNELLNSEDKSIRQLAIDLFKYNMYTNGFGYGMYEFSHFAPFSVLERTPGYLTALEGILNQSWEDNDDKENFIQQYIMNHWGDKKFLTFVPESKLPNYIRVPRGLSPLGPKADEAARQRIPADARYIVVTKGSGEDRVEELVRLGEKTGGVFHLLSEPVPGKKLAIVLNNGQWTKQYNPYVRYDVIEPVFPGNDSSWGVLDAADDNAYAESDYSSDPADPDYTEQHTNSLGSKKPIVGKKKVLGTSFFGLTKKTEGIRKLQDKAKAASAENAVSENESERETQPVQENERLIFRQDSSSDYPSRTKKNAKADATIAFALDFNTRGEKLTKDLVVSQGKQYIPITLFDDLQVNDEMIDSVVSMLNAVNAKSLNIAGNGIYTLKSKFTQQQIDDYVYEVLRRVVNHPALNNPIESIRSGGQSGVDEAGAKAGVLLGIKTGILAPMGWKYRNINGVDISGEQSFKARFESTLEAASRYDGMENVDLTPEDFNKYAPGGAEPTEQAPSPSGVPMLGVGFFKGKGKMLSIARLSEDGTVTVEKVEPTPENIREARRQQIFAELNSKLREILREKGVAIGVLDEFEARLSLAGITDFDTASVTAEGLLEMIRLAEGYRGEEALPEEFAHLAIELIGRDHPLVARLLNSLSVNDDALREAFGDDYDEYMRAYDSDREKMILEAAGKLVAKQLFREQEISTSPIRRLIHRISDAIKNFLRRFRRSEIQNAIFEANDIASGLARELLGGRILDDRTLNDIKASGELYAKAKKIKEDLTDKNDLLHRILKTEVKRLSIFQSRIGYDADKAKKSPSIIATEKQIENLRKSIKNHKVEDAVITYMADSFDFLEKTFKKMEEYIASGQPANKVCKRLNLVRDTLYSFSAVMDDVNKAITEGEIQDSVDLTNAISKTATALSKFYQFYNRHAMYYFEGMLKNIYGEHGITVDIGRDKGRVITIAEMARRADKDISLASRWFHSIADCNDYVLKAIDDLTRDAKYEARRRMQEIKPRIEKAVSDLYRETGSKDQSFMFEMKRYDGGKWCNGKKDDGELHKTGKYISVEKSRTLSKAQKNFYDTIMDIKKEADKFVPESLLEDDKIVMLRKYTWDRVKESEGIKNKTAEIWEGVRNSILDTSDSIDYDNYEVKVDFEGNRVDMLPVHYLAKGKNESYDDMIDDVATSVMAYAGMAFEYGELNNVIGILENAKNMSSQRDIIQHTGNRTQRETIVTDNIVFHSPFTKKQARTNIEAALEDFFQMHIYGHIQANEGTIGNTKISKRKAVDFINSVTSMSQMAINIPQRIANVSVGLTQILIESVGKGAFNAADTAYASKIYMLESADRIAETGQTDYDNKLSLWLDKFDVHQDNGRSYKSTRYNKSRASRAFNSSLLYAGLTMGEDYLAATTALAVARNFKMKGPHGEDANLWEAYEVAYTDPANKTGAYLKLKDGYKKADGSELTKHDERQFAKAIAGLNFELQGIYNLDDRSAVQQYALGALLIMYRKWIAPSLKRRYSDVHYNALKGKHEEGYHHTLFRLLHDSVVDAKNQVTEEKSAAALLNIIDDMKALRTAILINWNKMNDYEKSNIKRACTELATVAGLYTSCALLGKIPPYDYEGDDRGKILKWWDQTVFSQMLRLRTEIGAMAPTPMLVDEAMHILKSPFAAIGPLQNTINSFQLLLPSNYVQEIKSGRYRGHKKAYKYFRELPVISMFKKVDNFLDPSPLINYYQNDAQI